MIDDEDGTNFKRLLKRKSVDDASLINFASSHLHTSRLYSYCRFYYGGRTSPLINIG